MRLTEPANDQQRQEEDQAMIEYTYHRKAKQNPVTLQKGVDDDIKHGFTVPINIYLIQSIKDAMVCKFGIVEQSTISETGERIPKLRITHDQSFSILDQSKSLNYLIDLSKFPALHLKLGAAKFRAISQYDVAIIFC